MGWTDSHLHQFEKEGRYWGDPRNNEFDDDIDIIDESRVSIGKVLGTEGDSMVYVYDFGDDWRHGVVLEKTLPSEGDTKPVCLAGERRCPPEDVGGPHGYQEFLEVIFEPGHEEFAHFRGWADGKFHAEEFDLKAVNKAFGTGAVACETSAMSAVGECLSYSSYPLRYVVIRCTSQAHSTHA